MNTRFAAALFALALPVLAQTSVPANAETNFYKAFWMEKGERNFAGAMALYEQFLKDAPEHPLAKNAAEFQFALLQKTGKQKDAEVFAKQHAKLLGNVAVSAPVAAPRGDAPVAAPREGAPRGEAGAPGAGSRANPERIAEMKKQLEAAKAAGETDKVKQLEQQIARGERMAQAGGQGGQGGQGGRGGRGGMFGTKKLAEMTPEELDQFKSGLERMSGMVDMMRERAPEQAQAMEDGMKTLQTALDGNKLDAAQVALDKIREAMPRGGRGGNGGGNGGPGGGNGGNGGPGGGGPGNGGPGGGGPGNGGPGGGGERPAGAGGRNNGGGGNGGNGNGGNGGERPAGTGGGGGNGGERPAGTGGNGGNGGGNGGERPAPTGGGGNGNGGGGD